MNENKPNSKPAWTDIDEAPEWPDEAFERAEIRDGETVVREATGTLTRRGRPKLEHPKRQVTLRLDGDILDRLKAGGPGWQSRINDILRQAVES